jgi:hypothetical protein
MLSMIKAVSCCPGKPGSTTLPSWSRRTMSMPGILVIATNKINSRITDLTIASPAVGGRVPVTSPTAMSFAVVASLYPHTHRPHSRITI